MRRVWLIQFFGNALLIGLFYEWLGIRDSRVSQLVFSFLLGLGIFAGVVILHSRTFHAKPLRFALVLLIFLLIWWGSSFLPLGKAGQWIASTLTLRLRKPVNPLTVVRVLDDVRWAILWLLIPSLLLRLKNTKNLFLFVLLVVFGFVVPGLIVNAVPVLASTAAEIASFLLRFGFAYCLLITSCVAFARLTSGGRPVASHFKTADLP